MNIKDKRRAVITLTIIPLQFVLSWVLFKLPLTLENQPLMAIVQILISYLAFVVIICLNKSFLKSQWKIYRNNFGKKILFAILGVVLLHVILYLVRIPLKSLSAAADIDPLAMPLILSIPISLIPLTATLNEELILRHYLFYNIKNKYFKWIMFFVSAILFGLIHYNNFSGNLIQLIPYMVMGALLGLIYQFSGNIWASVSVHFLFNAINVALGLVGLIYIKIAQ